MIETNNIKFLAYEIDGTWKVIIPELKLSGKGRYFTEVIRSCSLYLKYKGIRQISNNWYEFVNS